MDTLFPWIIYSVLYTFLSITSYFSFLLYLVTWLTRSVFFEMNSEEFDHISYYLSDNVYPASILQLKNCRQGKKTFRLKASQYQLGANGKILKLIFNGIPIFLYIYLYY